MPGTVPPKWPVRVLLVVSDARGRMAAGQFRFYGRLADKGKAMMVKKMK